MELLIGFPGIGGHNMIATEDVDDDLWIFVLLEFVEDGASCSFAETSVDTEARASKNRSKGLQWRRSDNLHCL